MTQHEPERNCSAIISDALITTHLKRIYLQIYRVVQNVEDAQELTQDVFIKALSSANNLKASDKAAHWLSRIASNVAIDFLRRRRYRQTVNIDGIGDLTDTRAVNPEYNAISYNEYRHSAAHLKILTERERTAFLLKDVEEWPTPEVALQMGCSHATVRSHAANARSKLRNHALRMRRAATRDFD